MNYVRVRVTHDVAVVQTHSSDKAESEHATPEVAQGAQANVGTELSSHISLDDTDEDDDYDDDDIDDDGDKVGQLDSHPDAATRQANGGRLESRTPAPHGRPGNQDFPMHEAIQENGASAAFPSRPGHQSSPARTDEFGTFS